MEWLKKVPILRQLAALRGALALVDERERRRQPNPESAAPADIKDAEASRDEAPRGSSSTK